MSESESEFYGLLRHNYTVDVRLYLFTVGFRKCRIIYGQINETPLYFHINKLNKYCLFQCGPQANEVPPQVTNNDHLMLLYLGQ